MTSGCRRIRLVRCCEEENWSEEEGVAVVGRTDSRAAELALGLLVAEDETS